MCPRLPLEILLALARVIREPLVFQFLTLEGALGQLIAVGLLRGLACVPSVSILLVRLMDGDACPSLLLSWHITRSPFEIIGILPIVHS